MVSSPVAALPVLRSRDRLGLYVTWLWHASFWFGTFSDPTWLGCTRSYAFYWDLCWALSIPVPRFREFWCTAYRWQRCFPTASSAVAALSACFGEMQPFALVPHWTCFLWFFHAAGRQLALKWAHFNRLQALPVHSASVVYWLYWGLNWVWLRLSVLTG